MYEETPNKEEIDWLAERIREVYDYEKMKDCDIDYLYNQEMGMRADTKIFEVMFPDEESIFNEAVLKEENVSRESLTDAERMRLQMLKKEAETEIRRALGHRRELRRKHRNRIANSISDGLKALSSILPW